MRYVRAAARVLSGAVGLFGLGALAFVAWPLPDGLLEYRSLAAVRILDRTGQPLRELPSRPDGRATPLASSALPPQWVAALLAAEDHRFQTHPGVDPLAVLRAAWSNWKAGRVVSGGSTLTQQLARLLVPRPRTHLGKLQEALWALRLEAHLTKHQILEQLLNRAPFGHRTFGAEAAAQQYFGRAAAELSVGQAAALVALLRGPSAYDPYRHPERLRQRQAWVVARMVRTGRLSEEDARAALAAPLDLRAPDHAFRAPHFVQFVSAHLAEWGLGEATFLRTSIDPELQAAAEAAVAEELSRLRDRSVGQASALIVDNGTGEVLAYVGSGDFWEAERGGQVDGVQMLRQPGSALKPFVYLEAFARGYSASSVLADTDAHFPAAKGTYAPQNYDRRRHGPVRAREALASSYNVPAVRLAEALGPQSVLERLRGAGFASLRAGAEHYGLGLVLGNGEVSLWEAAQAYSGLARGGVLVPLRPILEARRADGSALAVAAAFAPRRFAGPTEVAVVTDILSDNAARAPAFGADSVLRLDFPAAAKTGTSKGYSDNWTVGYTRERTVAVWAGNFDGASMSNVSGITGAGPLFRALIQRAMRHVEPLPLWDPALLEPARICPLSGQRATAACPGSMEERFAKGGAPHEACAMHALVSGELAQSLEQRCRQLASATGRVTDFGPGFYDWARAEGLAAEPWLAAACKEQVGSARPAAPRIVFPTRGAEFQLLADLRPEDQAIPLRVEAAAREGRLEVRLNGAHLRWLEPPYTSRLAAVPGEHVVSLHREGAPAISTVRFTVRAEPSAL